MTGGVRTQTIVLRRHTGQYLFFGLRVTVVVSSGPPTDEFSVHATSSGFSGRGVVWKSIAIRSTVADGTVASVIQDTVGVGGTVTVEYLLCTILLGT